MFLNSFFGYVGNGVARQKTTRSNSCEDPKAIRLGSTFKLSLPDDDNDYAPVNTGNTTNISITVNVISPIECFDPAEFVSVVSDSINRGLTSKT